MSADKFKAEVEISGRKGRAEWEDREEGLCHFCRGTCIVLIVIQEPGVGLWLEFMEFVARYLVGILSFLSGQ